MCTNVPAAGRVGGNPGDGAFGHGGMGELLPGQMQGVPDHLEELKMKKILIAAVTAVLAVTTAHAQTPLLIPLFTADGSTQQGFVRIINHSYQAGTVRIYGTDDSGVDFGPVTLELDARQTRHFNSGDLETGNSSKGLSGALGNGSGNWRLRLETELDIELAAYIRTPDGFLSSVHESVQAADLGDSIEHQVAFFNPGGNRNQVSWLRLVNLTGDSVEVTIQGRDDAGQAASGGEVRLTLSGGEARRITAQQLESGAAGFTGRLGAGTGKWQLSVTADDSILVMSLLQSPTGHLTNLSTSLGASSDATAPKPISFRDCVGCPLVVQVPAGSFLMGSPLTEAGRNAAEGPVHRVTIARPFVVGVYEVTFDEWDACHRAGGCSHNAVDHRGWGRGDRPVTDVSWNDAKEYLRWLSGSTGRRYRLLSEAEWEYVARAGTTTRFWWGNAVGKNRANCLGCGSGWNMQTAPVGSFPENAFGLHEVHGNAWEWVEDCHHPHYVGAPVDGSAWTTWGDCGNRHIRGGSYTDSPAGLRSAERNLDGRVITAWRSENVGFRVARDLN